jgi:uroporphyrin-III C-methyltransferase/precorrin-2 dehydrogenase/sirohydrochlorin ferrochelatase
MHSLPVFLRLEGRPVILLGHGAAADAKRRLLVRAGAAIVGEADTAGLAIVAIEDDDAAAEAVARLRARGVLVNAVDRPALCDFTLPAIIDRDPVLIAIGTGGASAGLAKALRQRIEALLPARLGALATALHAARDRIRQRFPEAEGRRRAIDAALDLGGMLDPLGEAADVERWLADPISSEPVVVQITLRSPDPDDLTLREARWLGRADTLCHDPAIAPAILDRVRADARRIAGPCPDEKPPGITVLLNQGPQSGP